MKFFLTLSIAAISLFLSACNTQKSSNQPAQQVDTGQVSVVEQDSSQVDSLPMNRKEMPKPGVPNPEQLDSLKKVKNRAKQERKRN